MNSTIKPKPCKECGSLYHTPMYHKPRKPIAVRTPLPKPTAPIKRSKFPTPLMDSVTRRAWLATRSKWLIANPPDHKGYYKCHYCGVDIDSSIVTLDHKIPRSAAPHLRHEFSNLVPACFDCNYKKGSIHHDKYEHTCHE